VGRRDGVGEGGDRSGRRVGATAGVAAFAAAVFRVVASLGILLGPCPVDLVDGTTLEGVPAPIFLIAMAPAVDLVTLVGRCSDAVTREPDALMDLTRSFVTGTTPKAGNTSSASS
jgi:hypothetical protein